MRSQGLTFLCHVCVCKHAQTNKFEVSRLTFIVHVCIGNICRAITCVCWRSEFFCDGYKSWSLWCMHWKTCVEWEFMCAKDLNLFAHVCIGNHALTNIIFFVFNLKAWDLWRMSALANMHRHVFLQTHGNDYYTDFVHVCSDAHVQASVYAVGHALGPHHIFCT